jgi:hypothetical protein
MTQEYTIFTIQPFTHNQKNRFGWAAKRVKSRDHRPAQNTEAEKPSWRREQKHSSGLRNPVRAWIEQQRKLALEQWLRGIRSEQEQRGHETKKFYAKTKTTNGLGAVRTHEQQNKKGRRWNRGGMLWHTAMTKSKMKLLPSTDTDLAQTYMKRK